MKHQSGITLLEVIITVTILAIIATIGVPSFRNFIENNQARAATNEMVLLWR